MVMNIKLMVSILSNPGKESEVTSSKTDTFPEAGQETVEDETDTEMKGFAVILEEETNPERGLIVEDVTDEEQLSPSQRGTGEETPLQVGQKFCLRSDMMKFMQPVRIVLK